MALLDSNTLKIGLDQSLKLGSQPISAARINRYISSVSQKGGLQNDTPETSYLFKLASNALKCIKPERLEALKRCEVYTLPFAYCNAFSFFKGHREIIVIGSGLLNLMSATSRWSLFCSSLPNSLNTIYPFENIPDLSAREGISRIIFSLLEQSYKFGEDVPNIPATSELKAALNEDISNGVMFMLLHELGHSELGHLQSSLVRPSFVELLIDQDISKYQNQEFEADHFVYDSLLPDRRNKYHNWINSALAFFSYREATLNEPKERHPLTFNRLYQAHQTSMHLAEASTKQELDEHYSQLHKNFLIHQTHQEEIVASGDLPVLEKSSRQATIETLMSFRPLLLDHNVNIEGILDGSPFEWQKALI